MSALQYLQGLWHLSWSPESVPLVLVFFAVAFAIFGIGALIYRDEAVSQRMRGVGRHPDAASRPSVQFQATGALQRLVVEPLSGRLVPSDARERSAVTRRLLQAGFPGPHAVAAYYVFRIILAIGVPGIFLVLLPFLAPGMDVPRMLLLVAVLGLIGYLAPTFYVIRRIARRQLLFREAFPDALDLLLICTEAGLGLDSAIQHVGVEIGKPYPLLGEQFQLMATELRAGKPRNEALRGLTERIGIEEIRSFSNLIAQSDSLGTSIGDALRAHANDMRQKRMLTAEEKAHKLAVKLSMILALFILPSLLITIMMPTVVAGGRLLFAHYYSSHPF